MLGSALVLFYIGCSFAYFVVLPAVFTFLNKVTPAGVTMMTDISNYLDFVLVIFLAFGASFELPVALVILALLGWVTPKQLREWRGYAIVAHLRAGGGDHAARRRLADAARAADDPAVRSRHHRRQRGASDPRSPTSRRRNDARPRPPRRPVSGAAMRRGRWISPCSRCCRPRSPWSRLLAGLAGTAAVALQRLSDLLGHALADALLQGTPPATLAQGLLADPAIRAAAEAVQAGIAHAAAPG